MKRSEILKIIAVANAGDYLKSAEENILEAIEKAGMMPPAHVINTLNSVHYFPDRKVYEWEKE